MHYSLIVERQANKTYENLQVISKFVWHISRNYTKDKAENDKSNWRHFFMGNAKL